MRRPHSGKTIGLQFQPHGGVIRTPSARLLLVRANLITDTQQILNMMPDFVRDDVCLREIAWRMEAIFQFLKETGVEVDLLIRRTIERTHRCLTKAACGLHSASEQDEFWFAVSLAFAPEDIRPRIFRVAENSCDEVFGCFIRR